jgi:hypothetical protein
MAPPRKTAIRPVQSAAEDSELKRWAMLLFESAGVGMMSVILILALVLLAVGVYVQLIWPLTDWDLVTVAPVQYNSTVSAVLTTIFVIGFFAGFWFISGAAWKRIKRPRPIFAQRVVARSRR